MTQRHFLLTPDEVTSNPVVASDSMPPPAGDDVASNPSTEDMFIDDGCMCLLRHTALAFVPLDLEPMPITTGTLVDLLYYRYGFSLNEEPYTGIPLSVTGKATSKTFRSWILVEGCRAVGTPGTFLS
jgi:hypothetical protein